MTERAPPYHEDGLWHVVFRLSGSVNLEILGDIDAYESARRIALGVGQVSAAAEHLTTRVHHG